jgi:hypothetical protein
MLRQCAQAYAAFDVNTPVTALLFSPASSSAIVHCGMKFTLPRAPCSNQNTTRLAAVSGIFIKPNIFG